MSDSEIQEGQPSEEVRGTRQARYISGNRTETRPHAQPGEIVAVVDDVEYPAVVATDGTFTIPGVPEGEYVLRLIYNSDRIWKKFRVTGARELELGITRTGRADQRRPALPTKLEFHVTGAEGPLRLYSPDAGVSSELPSIDWYQNLIDASRGDRAWLLGMRTIEPDTSVVTGVLALDDLVMTDGGWHVVTGALTAPTRWRTVPIRVPAEVLPEAMWLVASIAAAPSGHAWSPPVLAETWADTRAEMNVDLTYGDPFPDDWTRVISYTFYSTRVPGLLEEASVTRELDAGSLTIELSQPRNIRISGLDATVPQQGVGPRPTVTWDPPELGEAAAYHIYVCNPSEVGTVTTTATEVTLPEPLDQPFMLVVEATTYENRYDQPLLQASAKTVTATHTP